MKKIHPLFIAIFFFGSFFKGYSGGMDSTWVDSVFHSLTPEQRIAQLFFIRAYSCRDSVYEDSLTKVIQSYNIGGICFFKGAPVHQARLTNRFQQAAPTPLLISIDAEWGLGMRLDSALSFPRQMTLGAIQDDSLIYLMGIDVANACKRLGVHMNLAPVVDINNNPQNPVINFRSFGENPFQVSKKGLLYMKGIQDGGIVAVAKHFPGHGDTDSDSHLILPIIHHSISRMDSVELLPFKTLIKEGVKGIMIAHLYLPCYDSISNIPATLSKNIVSGLLQNQLGYTGFVITDALDMQGVTKYYKPGQIEVKALEAGNDILLLPQDVPAAIRAIRQAVDSGLISQEYIDQKCRRLLGLKFQAGLVKTSVINIINLNSDLNPERDIALRNILYKSALTITKNEIQLVPLQYLDRRKIASVSIGDTVGTPFQQYLSLYAHVDPFTFPSLPVDSVADSLLRLLARYDILLIGLHHLSSFPTDSFGLSCKTVRFLDTLFHLNRCVLVLFGNPYAFSAFPKLLTPETILMAYQDNPVTEKLAAELIFGGIPAKGKQPVSIPFYPSGTGERTEKTRLEYSIPEELGIPSSSLLKIDSITNEGIAAGAFPGCQILFAKNGQVFYNKSFGNPRYGDSLRVDSTELYDLASLTKITATTLAVMKLYEEELIELDDSLGKYLPELTGSNKSGLLIRDVMAHQARLQSWIPFYEKILNHGVADPSLIQPDSSQSFSIRIADNLFLKTSYQDSIFVAIVYSPLRSYNDYKYSDLGFYLLKKIVEKRSGMSFDRYLTENFYKPLGLQHIGFHPRWRFPRSEIAPTEMDTIFRRQLVWGDVHDPGAAMLGGISGHAGLFSNAMDLAVIMQMLLQNGQYGGKQYLLPTTIQEFTRVQFPKNGNRRGLGFDKPLLICSSDGPVCESASPSSFGHSGFTGTYIWADPENQLIYVFLSNRVYPTATNQKLSGMNIRTNIHQVVYDVLKKYQIK